MTVMGWMLAVLSSSVLSFNFLKELSYPKTLAESAKLGSLKSVGLHLKMHDARKPKLKTSIAELHARLKHQRRHAPFWTTGD